MTDQIINRVANSKLITLNLEDYYPKGDRLSFDIKNWLYEGLVLQEKNFRQAIKDYNWAIHQDQYIAITCSTDAIIPVWAYTLLTIALEPYAKKIIVGDLEQLESSIYQDIIANLDVTQYKNKPIIIKGCANKPIPKNAYLQLTTKLIPIAKSIMYGEACSSVPLFKR